MRKSKFSETQIVEILRAAESGVPVADLLRKPGGSKATFFKWRSKYGGASVSDVKRLRELEAENAKLKRMYADLALDRATRVANVVVPLWASSLSRHRDGTSTRQATLPPSASAPFGC